ncbi:hypothetical protein E2C01_023802 [Portunus trituberculatus]|uniref:Uncharacterized protein n=1 Tax=Portunus trituberculatus TaxID=210409 RepID=A0A5B7EB09_PORTR|nr:hypothetical protein [Portunus trituberculatus]
MTGKQTATLALVTRHFASLPLLPVTCSLALLHKMAHYHRLVVVDRALPQVEKRTRTSNKRIDIISTKHCRNFPAKEIKTPRAVSVA